MTRQFQITVEEGRLGDVAQFLKDRGGLEVTKIHANNVFLLVFRVADGEVTSLLGELAELGVGREHSRVDVLNLEASKPMMKVTKKKSGRKERLTVEGILANVRAITALNFDFLMFLLSASLIAAGGLAADSVVSVVASMLVSPIMGPILGFSFGTVIHDWSLALLGLRNEIIAVSITVFLGFMSAFLFLYWGPDIDWPTEEMSSRGEVSALYYGTLVATASGIGVAISVTSGTVNSLVGVAISASLLPPAVNAGMLLNYGLFGPLVHGQDEVSRKEMLEMSGISFALLLVNISCIIVSANITFWLKAIAPVQDRSDYYAEIKEARQDDLDFNFEAGMDEEKRKYIAAMHEGGTSTRRSTSSPHNELHHHYDDDDGGVIDESESST